MVDETNKQDLAGAASDSAKAKGGQTRAGGDAIEKGTIVVSSAQPGGRRRAGRTFGTEPVTIDLKDLKKGELALLESDPLLSTKRIT